MINSADKTDNVEARTGHRRLPWNYVCNGAIKRLQAHPRVYARELNRAAGLAWEIYQTPAYILTGSQQTLRINESGYVLDCEPGRLNSSAQTRAGACRQRLPTT